MVLTRIQCDLRGGFERFLAGNPEIQLIFVGVRRTDPHCASLQPFDPTDNGWPSFTRCHPILEWSYVDIWSYLRCRNIPFCRLYERGYTSLGARSKTRQNPHLLVFTNNNDAEIHDDYRPAYELKDEQFERSGRSNGNVILDSDGNDEKILDTLTCN